MSVACKGWCHWRCGCWRYWAEAWSLLFGRALDPLGGGEEVNDRLPSHVDEVNTGSPHPNYSDGNNCTKSAGFFLQLAGSLSSPRGLSTISPQFEFRKRSLLSDELWLQIQWPSYGDSRLHHRPGCDQSSTAVAMDFCWAP